MSETPQEIVWRLEKECIRLRSRAERAEAHSKHLLIEVAELKRRNREAAV